MNTAEPAIPPARTELLAADLSQTPQVNALLTDLGLGCLTPTGVVSYPGRNKNWAGATSGGHQVFVKQLDGRNGQERLARAVAYERTRAVHGSELVLSPRCLGWDESARLMVFELLPDATSGSDCADRDDGFGPDWCDRAGRMTAATHHLPTDQPEQVEPTTSFLPLTHLEALPLHTFAQASRAELEAWALLQHDHEITDALNRLDSLSARVPRRPSHTDLRLDQFLIRGGQLYLTDWEEFRRADPARDIGSFVGEWLHRAVLAAVPQDTATRLTPGGAMARMTAEIERVRPRIQAFWQGYRAASAGFHPVPDTPPPHDRQPEAGLAARAAAFAGWHLYDRLLAGASQSARLGAFSRAAAGIGRNIVLRADHFTAAIGLEGTS
ncbi:class V lanthionine synthetase subunit LxmK [Streptomyces sp. CS113]|uniref:class V lanthionine synthetase subunit LxmK n=1 Tax=Streptomyces sp. CS113 TaxID=1982761 RepID=UPI00211ABC66|nr:class V lanthionine synthetase subunit LxmK [Streptomyces sp. CS113]